MGEPAQSGRNSHLKVLVEKADAKKVCKPHWNTPVIETLFHQICRVETATLL